MVDKRLPEWESNRQLGYLFLDLNGYFAAVEQQLNPALRGRPVAVTPVNVDSGMIIAASSEAKRFGVKCGVLVGDARLLCPGLIVVPAPRHSHYVEFHEKIKHALRQVLPLEDADVQSIDEMFFRLIGTERTPEVARELATEMKARLREDVGECITASVGIAPNSFLAKLASDMQKPDGLVILTVDDLPDALLHLRLTDFCGINRRMKVRLEGHGILTVEGLYRATKEQLRAAFGSKIGEDWWYLLRGMQMEKPSTARKSLGHSHVLPPEFRSEKGCHEVLLRLLQKAAVRLRREGLVAGDMHVYVKGKRRSWEASVRLTPTSDTMQLHERLKEAWAARDFQMPIQVGITFHDLVPPVAVTPSLFEPVRDLREITGAMDEINKKHGKNMVYIAGMHKSKDAAEEKIAFQKTSLYE
ncbi:DNA polymerase [bacterium]|nr:MAG: DNA polymerase [bacterium]